MEKQTNITPKNESRFAKRMSNKTPNTTNRSPESKRRRTQLNNQAMQSIRAITNPPNPIRGIHQTPNSTKTTPSISKIDTKYQTNPYKNIAKGHLAQLQTNMAWTNLPQNSPVKKAMQDGNGNIEEALGQLFQNAYGNTPNNKWNNVIMQLTEAKNTV